MEVTVLGRSTLTAIGTADDADTILVVLMFGQYYILLLVGISHITYTIATAVHFALQIDYTMCLIQYGIGILSDGLVP